MAQTALDKHTHALISLYLKEYEAKYGRTPMDFNRYRQKWGFKSMIEDLGWENAQRVVKYYLSTNRPAHTVEWLFRNYDRVLVIILERESDEADRAKLRANTKKRVEEMENSGN